MSKDKMQNIFKSGQEDMETQWISISDIMTVLMVIFLIYLNSVYEANTTTISTVKANK